MSNQFKALSDKTKATDAIIKDSELDDYIYSKELEGREVKFIDANGDTRPCVSKRTLEVAASVS